MNCPFPSYLHVLQNSSATLPSKFCVYLVIMLIVTGSVFSQGLLAVSEAGQNRISLNAIDADFCSGTGSGAKEFNNPAGMDFHDGTLYIADKGNSRIVAIDGLKGNNWRSFGELGTGMNQFDSPTDIKVGVDGWIYIADAGNDRVVRIRDMKGKNWQEFGSFGAQLGRFFAPSAIAIGPEGRLFVADKYNNRAVMMENFSGKKISEFGMDADFDLPQGIFVDDDGQIFISDYYHSRIIMYETPESSSFSIFRWPFYMNKGFRHPIHITSANKKNLIVANEIAGTIFSLLPGDKPEWNTLTKVFDKPYGVAVTDWRR